MQAKVLSIVGPTGVGKSHLALDLARQCRLQGQNVEIISMDSALVYRDWETDRKSTRLNSSHRL